MATAGEYPSPAVKPATEQLDSSRTGWAVELGLAGIACAFFGGMTLVGKSPWASVGAAGLIAFAALLGGALVGFLFGLPRAKAADTSGNSPSYRPNSNLEEMSDWMTKLIVGIGLIQLGTIADAFSRASQAAGVAIGFETGAQFLAGAWILFFAVTGFLGTYLWARTLLERTFALADGIVVRLEPDGGTAGANTAQAGDTANHQRSLIQRIHDWLFDRRPVTGTSHTPMNIEDVEGIGPAYAAKLTKAGVKTTDDLLARGAKPKGRDELEKATGISHAEILGWVNRVDLYRLTGVGSEYSDLLEEAGVDSPAELSHRVADHLAAKLEEINKAKKLVRRVPTETMVAGWIEQAKKLPKVVEH